jgi:3',5'-cyclic AMP phosphodiesterase CpdA
MKHISKKLLLILLILFLFQTNCNANVKFAVISDPHISMPADGVKDDFKMGLHSVEFLENTIKDVNNIEDLDFVLFLGDLTKDGEPWNLDKFLEIMSDLNVPSYAILGNHDQSVITQTGKECLPGVSKETMVWALQGHGFKGPSLWWSADPVPGLHIIGLDTNIPGTWSGTISDAQLKWLEGDLSSNRDIFTIVLGHHSIVPFSKEEEQTEQWKSFYMDKGEKLLEVFEKYKNISFYLSGHRHVSTRAVEHNGIYHIVHPSTSTYPMRYTIYELTEEYLTYEVKNVPMDKETWELAKKNFFTFGEGFWRGTDMTDTVEGNKKYLDYYESNETLKGKFPLRSGTINIK